MLEYPNFNIFLNYYIFWQIRAQASLSRSPNNFKIVNKHVQLNYTRNILFTRILNMCLV